MAKYKYQNYWKNDSGVTNNKIRHYANLVSKIQDVFVIYEKKEIVFVTNKAKEMMTFIFNEKVTSPFYYLEKCSDFLENFSKDSCKWRTFNNLKVLKYNNTMKLTKNISKLINLDLKNPQIQIFFREEKLKRVLEKNKKNK